MNSGSEASGEALGRALAAMANMEEADPAIATLPKSVRQHLTQVLGEAVGEPSTVHEGEHTTPDGWTVESTSTEQRGSFKSSQVIQTFETPTTGPVNGPHAPSDAPSSTAAAIDRSNVATGLGTLRVPLIIGVILLSLYGGARTLYTYSQEFSGWWDDRWSRMAAASDNRDGTSAPSNLEPTSPTSEVTPEPSSPASETTLEPDSRTNSSTDRVEPAVNGHFDLADLPVWASLEVVNWCDCTYPDGRVHYKVKPRLTLTDDAPAAVPARSGHPPANDDTILLATWDEPPNGWSADYGDPGVSAPFLAIDEDTLRAFVPDGEPPHVDRLYLLPANLNREADPVGANLRTFATAWDDTEVAPGGTLFVADYGGHPVFEVWDGVNVAGLAWVDEDGRLLAFAPPQAWGSWADPSTF